MLVLLAEESHVSDWEPVRTVVAGLAPSGVEVAAGLLAMVIAPHATVDVGNTVIPAAGPVLGHTATLHQRHAAVPSSLVAHRVEMPPLADNKGSVMCRGPKQAVRVQGLLGCACWAGPAGLVLQYIIMYCAHLAPRGGR